MNTCKDCKQKFDKELLPKWFMTKSRCVSCFKIYKSAQDKKYRERMGRILLDKKIEYQKNGGSKKQCNVCKNDFYGAWKGPKYCSRKCYFEHEKISRKGKGNPAYRNGTRTKGKGYNYTHSKATTKYRQDFMFKNNHLYCEECKTNQSLRFEVHHIVFASEKPRHEYLHDFRNLIMVCIQCHNNFHAGVTREKRKHLVDKRKLDKLFGQSIL